MSESDDAELMSAGGGIEKRLRDPHLVEMTTLRIGSTEEYRTLFDIPFLTPWMAARL